MLKLKSPSELEERKSDNIWLIDRLLLSDAAVIIGGNPKTKKSWLSADLAIAIATGTKALGTYEVKTPFPVIFLQAEDSEGVIRERLDGIARTRGFCADSLQNIHVCSTQEFRLDIDEHLASLENAILETKAKAVFIDPLARFLGDISDGSVAPMMRLLSKLRTLQRKHKVTLVLTQHLKKSSSKDIANNLRGSSDLRSFYDEGIFLTKPTNEITQVDFELKSYREIPSVFFKLANHCGGLGPIALSYETCGD